MSKIEEPTWKEHAREWWNTHWPWAEENTLADATHKWNKVGPWDFCWEGMPSYYVQKFLFVLGGIFFIIMYFVTDACVNVEETGFVMELALLEKLNLLSGIALLVGVVAIIHMLLDSHLGTFGKFKVQVDPLFVRDLSTRKPTPVVLRVYEAWEVWPPTGKVAEIVEEARVLRDAVKGLEPEAPKEEIDDALGSLMELM